MPRRKVERSEIEEAMKKLGAGKPPRADGTTAGKLRYEGVVAEWMLWIYHLA